MTLSGRGTHSTFESSRCRTMQLAGEGTGAIGGIRDTASCCYQLPAYRSRSMPKITYIDFNGTPRTVEGEVGATLMETAIKNGVPGINAECGGACSCSTCHVYVDEAWEKAAGTPGPIEEDMLDFA